MQRRFFSEESLQVNWKRISLGELAKEESRIALEEAKKSRKEEPKAEEKFREENEVQRDTKI